MTTQKLIGLSFGSCVLSIQAGQVSIDEIDYIQSSILPSADNMDWEKTITSYRENGWTRNPEKCEAIARQLIQAGKVRFADSESPVPDLSQGYWIQREYTVKQADEEWERSLDAPTSPFSEYLD